MRIAFFMQGAPGAAGAAHVSPVMDGIFATLREAGARIDLIVAEAQAWDLSGLEPQHDLYVLKSKSPLTLSLAAILSERGATIVNSVESCRLARDKIAAEVALAASKLPVPPAWATGQAQQLRPLLAEGPLWLKERSGSKGRGVVRLTGTSDVAAMDDLVDAHGLPQPLFAQREAPSVGRDTKIYVVGDRQWAITRPWPARTAEDKLGQACELTPELRALAAACGHALGLEIYGVDILVEGSARHIVDVNAFPGFKGIPEAPQAIAHHLLARARGKPAPAE